MRSVYDNLQVGAPAITLGSLAGVVTTGDSVDTKGYNSAALRVITTAIGTGLAPNRSGSVTAVLEESSDNSTFAAANDNGGTQIQATASATVTAVLASARIEGLNQNRLRYLRVKLTTFYTAAGTSPSAGRFTAAGVIELGRGYNWPVTSTVSNT